MSLLFKRSTIKWCEENSAYSYSIYIAEFFNTLTGLCLCLSAYVFYKMNENNSSIINKLRKSLILLFVVGVGTVLFHSTLLYVFQMTDEIPMLLLALEYYYLVNSMNFNVYDNYLSYLTLNFKYKIYGMSFGIFIIGYISDFLQVLVFQSTLMYIIYLILYKFYLCNKQIENNLEKLYKRKAFLEEQFLYHYFVNNKLKLIKKNINNANALYTKIKIYKYIGLFLTLNSFIVWYIDKNHCNSININGHALWHILTSIGLFCLNNIIIFYYQLINLILSSKYTC